MSLLDSLGRSVDSRSRSHAHYLQHLCARLDYNGFVSAHLQLDLRSLLGAAGAEP